MTVRVDLRQDFRLRGVLYRKGLGVEMPKDVAVEAYLYKEEAPKAAGAKTGRKPRKRSAKKTSSQGE